VPGVYIWTHIATGSLYVGSSSTLARRLIGYFKNTHKTTGKLIKRKV
jgi:excinuclease UvrABC nuclease subunit